MAASSIENQTPRYSNNSDLLKSAIDDDMVTIRSLMTAGKIEEAKVLNNAVVVMKKRLSKIESVRSSRKS